jgi:hypothetical protein
MLQESRPAAMIRFLKVLLNLLIEEAGYDVFIKNYNVGKELIYSS